MKYTIRVAGKNSYDVAVALARGWSATAMGIAEVSDKRKSGLIAQFDRGYATEEFRHVYAEAACTLFLPSLNGSPR